MRVVTFTLAIMAFLHFFEESYGLKCYLDTNGSYPPKVGEPLITDDFKVFNCNIRKQSEEKVRKIPKFINF